MIKDIPNSCKKLKSYLRSLLSEDGVRDVFLTYSVGVEIINILEEDDADQLKD